MAPPVPPGEALLRMMLFATTVPPPHRTMPAPPLPPETSMPASALFSRVLP